MANEGQHSDQPELAAGDDIDKVLGQANPNPTRAGCPPREVLIELARRKRPIGDPAYEHLTKCSPCYREFRALQGAQAPQPRVAAFKWVAAAAATLVPLVGGWVFFVAEAGVFLNAEHAAAQPFFQRALGLPLLLALLREVGAPSSLGRLVGTEVPVAEIPAGRA